MNHATCPERLPCGHSRADGFRELCTLLRRVRGEEHSTSTGMRPYARWVEFNEVIKRRRMVHAFTAEPLAPLTAERLLRAANRAPSAGFSQGYSFLVLEGKEEA